MWDTPVSFHPRSPDDCGERNRGNCVSRLPKCKPECIRSSKSVAGQKPRTHPWGAEAWVSAPAWNWLFFFFFFGLRPHTHRAVGGLCLASGRGTRRAFGALRLPRLPWWQGSVPGLRVAGLGRPQKPDEPGREKP